jgi:hypothetical protein
MPIVFVRKYSALFIIACLLIASAAFGQPPAITTTIDKSNILIGEQLQLKVEAALPPGTSGVDWFSIPDSIEHFEVINRSKIDSSYTDNVLTGLSQSITLTSFDSGQWRIPSFPIDMHFATDSVRHLFTDTASIGVYFMTSDTTNTLKDIKPIRQVPPPDMFWYWVIGAVLVLLLIAAIVWIIYLFRKEKPAVSAKSIASAYKEAMDAIEKLNQYDLTDVQQVKTFHSKLAEIFKRYLSHIQNKNRLNQTTDEVLISVKEKPLDAEIFSNLAAALRCSDAVKFAKYHPSVNISKDSQLSIKKTIESLNQ